MIFGLDIDPTLYENMADSNSKEFYLLSVKVSMGLAVSQKKSKKLCHLLGSQATRVLYTARKISLFVFESCRSLRFFLTYPRDK